MNNESISEAEEKLRKLLDVACNEVVKPLWRYPTKDWVSSVYAADVDGDGDIEAVIGSRDSSVYVVSKLGGEKWPTPFVQPKKWAGAVWAIEYVGPNHPHIFAGSRDSNVYALDELGRLVWQEATGHVVRSLWVADIDADGIPEVVAGSEDRCVHAFNAFTGERKWSYETNGWIRTVVAYDIDGNGKCEIIAGSGDKKLYFITSDGQTFLKPIFTGSKIHSLYAGEIGEGGSPKIVVSSDAKDLYVLDLETLDKQPLEKEWVFWPENRILCISAVDITGDGLEEIVAGSEDKHIYFLDPRKKKLLWKHYVGYRVFCMYPVDINRDGRPELIIGGEDRCAHVANVYLQTGLLDQIKGLATKIGIDRLTTVPSNDEQRFELQGILYGVDEQKLAASLDVLEPIASPELPNTLEDLLMLEHQHAKLVWREEVGLVRSIALGDIDGDGRLEVGMGTDDGDVIVVDDDGKRMWTYKIGDRVWMVQVADVDRDGSLEVVAGAGDGNAYVIDKNGESPKRIFELGDWIRSVYVTNTEVDDYPHIVLGTEDHRIHIYQSNGQDYVQEIDPINSTQSIRAIWASDFDRDGNLELIAGADDDNVYAYTTGGIELWRFETKDRIRGLKVIDLDQDGDLEILVASEDRNLYVLDSLGNLKWRYMTPHRVLDVDAADLDSDGQNEVVLGSGDGHVYVLTSEGEFKWRYRVSDRVRAVRVDRIFESERYQVIVGSEDRRVYVIEPNDDRMLSQRIEMAWQNYMLQNDLSILEAIGTAARSQNSLLRALAVRKISELGELNDSHIRLLEALAHDPALVVRETFARHLDRLFRIDQEALLIRLDDLSGDVACEVRIAFVERIQGIVDSDFAVGIEYLSRFVRDANVFVRRAAVRVLSRLLEDYPSRSYDFLLRLVSDEDLWIRQETARVIAAYVGLRIEEAISVIRGLVARGVDVEVLELIGYRVQERYVQDIFEATVYLIRSDFGPSNVEDRLERMVHCLSEATTLRNSAEALFVYNELLLLHKIATVDQIADYRYTGRMQGGPDLQFNDTYKILESLSSIGRILSRYLRRDRLGDQVASLTEAITTIEQLRTNLGTQYFLDVGSRRYPDRYIFEILLERWREIVIGELHEVRGVASLEPMLLTRRVLLEKQVVIILNIYNRGKSPADNVLVRLLPSQDYDICGDHQLGLESISGYGDNEQVEFTIRPKCSSLRVSFIIEYDDAEARGQTQPFADMLELTKTKSEFKHIPGDLILYQAGLPVSSDLFFDREEELELIRRHVSSDVDNVLVLYGPRRSGKTSILKAVQQKEVIAPHIPVLIDLQGLIWPDYDTGKFLYYIASVVSTTVRHFGLSITTPAVEDFSRLSTVAFDNFIQTVVGELNDNKMLLMFDEIQDLQTRGVERGHISPDVFTYLRHLMQHAGESVRFLMAGTHKLELMASQYWSVFFQIAIQHEIKPLSDEWADRLIKDPAARFLVYDDFAIERIRLLAANQPYFIQLICLHLVSHCQEQEKNYVTVNDVNVVLDEVLQSGSMYFSWAWHMYGSSDLERLVMAALAQESGQQDLSVRIDDIMQVLRRYGISVEREKIAMTLESLVDNNVVVRHKPGGKYRIAVKLVGLWLRRYKGMRQVLREIDASQL